MIDDVLTAALHPEWIPRNAPHPCDACPWRLANQGRADDPHGFYTAENLDSLWSELRGGERMSCHQTDSRMAEYLGYENTAQIPTISECTGAIIPMQREVARFVEICRELDKLPRDPSRIGIDVYHERHPNGLTVNGMIANAERVAFQPTLPGRVAPNLNEPGVGYAPLGEWEAPDGGH